MQNANLFEKPEDVPHVTGSSCSAFQEVLPSSRASSSLCGHEINLPLEKVENQLISEDVKIQCELPHGHGQFQALQKASRVSVFCSKFRTYLVSSTVYTDKKKTKHFYWKHCIGRVVLY